LQVSQAIGDMMLQILPNLMLVRFGFIWRRWLFHVVFDYLLTLGQGQKHFTRSNLPVKDKEMAS
jgi:hypothetical protein